MIPIVPNQNYWDQFVAAAAWGAANDAQMAIASLLSAFGSSTEPDFTSITTAYNRVLAIALLLLGSVIAFALIERIIGGPQGAGWAGIGRVLVAVFFAYSGLGVIEYVANYSALLATTWNGDFNKLATLIGNSAGSSSASLASRTGPHVNLVGLVLTALFLNLMAVLVYLELIVRSALILTVSVFLPLICALAVWPRMAGAATRFAEFLLGLLLSKFVVATALYVGLHLVIPSLVSRRVGSGTADWMTTGIAVLVIAAFSPMVLFQALHFAHGSAGTVVREVGAAGIGSAPITGAVGFGRRLLRTPAINSGPTRLIEAMRSGVRRRSRG